MFGATLMLLRSRKASLMVRVGQLEGPKPEGAIVQMEDGIAGVYLPAEVLKRLNAAEEKIDAPPSPDQDVGLRDPGCLLGR